MATVVLVRGDVGIASWPLDTQDPPTLAVVDALARLQLAARGLGCSIRVLDAGPDLWELLDLAGLAPLVCGASTVQVGGETEGGEEVGVEEVVMPDDPVA